MVSLSMTAISQVPTKSLPRVFHHLNVPALCSGPSSCAGCLLPIQDQYLLNVMGKSWHASCVLCSECGQTLQERCYTREGKIFCREDFFRRFGEKCAVCSIGIPPNVLVRKARGKVFHLACFVCMVCRKQLTTGDELVMFNENSFMCKEDYINSKILKCEEEDMDHSNQPHQSSTNKCAHENNKKDVLFDEALVFSSKIHQMQQKADEAPKVMSRFYAIDSIRQLVANEQDDDCQKQKDGDFENLRIDLNTEIKDEDSKNRIILSNLSSPSSSDNEQTSSCDQDKTADKDKENNIEDFDDLNTVVDDTEFDESLGSDREGSSGGVGGLSSGAGKRRGPRTTIKAKQLETLKNAFAATPKPTRHIREQLAQETGLNMRVIQVWFQNRRSKERRMKQLSAMGARRGFFRNPRRMRALRAGALDQEDLGTNHELLSGRPFNYFGDNGTEFFGGYGSSSGYPAELFHQMNQIAQRHPHFMDGQRPHGQLHGFNTNGLYFSNNHPIDYSSNSPSSSASELQQRLVAMNTVNSLQQQISAAAAVALESNQTGTLATQHQIPIGVALSGHQSQSSTDISTLEVW